MKLHVVVPTDNRYVYSRARRLYFFSFDAHAAGTVSTPRQARLGQLLDQPNAASSQVNTNHKPAIYDGDSTVLATINADLATFVRHAQFMLQQV
jgi:hypothetical protein